jgi:hypothetical protein
MTKSRSEEPGAPKIVDRATFHATSKRLDEDWPENPIFGKVSGTDISRLQAKHLDHHLKQFGV